MEPKKAIFNFENFKISNFSFNEPTPESLGLGLDISPSGKYSKNDGRFEVKLHFRAYERYDTSDGTIHNDSASIEVIMIAVFKFEEGYSYSDIPDFFYMNSVAIAFPYLRAFISSLTCQANIQTLILPVLNLTGLDKPLKENTILVENL